MLQLYRVTSDLAQCGQEPVVLSLIQRLQQIILDTLEPDEMGAKFAQALSEAFSTDACLLIVRTQAQPVPLILGWATQAIALQSPEVAATLDPFWSILALQPGKQLRWSDIAHNTASEPALERAIVDLSNHVLSHWQCPPVHDCLAMGLGTPSDQCQGLVVLLKQSTHEWTQTETTHLHTLVDITAIALVQVTQLRHMQTLQRDVFLAQQYQNLSHNVLGNFHRTLAQDQLLQVALQTTVQALQADRGLLLLLKYEVPSFGGKRSQRTSKAKVVLKYAWQSEHLNNDCPTNTYSSSADEQSTWFWLADCQLCQRVFSDFDQTLVIDQLTTIDTNHLKQIAPIFRRDEFAACMMTPLFASTQAPGQGSILGFWVMQHSQPHLWNGAEQQFAESIAALVSSVILHNQTLRQVQTLVEERTAQLEQNQRIQTKLYEVSRQQVEQLRQLNQLKDEFLDTLSHELRTPLTSMKMAITMLRQPGMLTDRASKYLDVLEQEWSRENNLIKDLLLLQELESSPVISPTHATDVAGLVQDIAHDWRDRCQTKQLSLQIDIEPTLPSILTDPQSLKRVLQELFTNASKFARSQTTVQVKLTRELIDNEPYVVLALTNYGIGITASEQAVIFEKFRRGQGVTQKAIPGVGLGLALVKCFLKQLQGKIEVHSHAILEADDFWETRFTLRLPVQPTDTTEAA